MSNYFCFFNFNPGLSLKPGTKCPENIIHWLSASGEECSLNPMDTNNISKGLKRIAIELGVEESFVRNAKLRSTM